MIEEKDALLELGMDEYQALDAYSRSDLMLVKKSAYHLKAKREGIVAEKDIDTPSMVLGELVHCLILERDTFDERYLVSPNIDKRTKIGKQTHQDMLELACGRTLVNEKVFAKACMMAKNMFAHDLTEKALKGTLVERSLVWLDDETGLNFKCRPDAYNPVNGIVCDVKTTKDASYRGVQASSVKYGYFLQAAMIQEALKFHGLPFSRYVLLYTENSEPFASAPYVLDDSAIGSGIDEFSFLKKRLATAQHEDKFEQYPLKTLFAPTWANNDYLTED